MSVCLVALNDAHAQQVHRSGLACDEVMVPSQDLTGSCSYWLDEARAPADVVRKWVPW